MGRTRIPENQKLSNALDALHQVLGSDFGVVKGKQLKQSEREILLKHGFLREIIKGWYFVSDPSASEGDTTPFFVNYWEYVSRYLEERFGHDYCLSAEHSLLLHAENNVIPKQINIATTFSVTQKVDLYDDYSLVIYPSKKISDLSQRDVIKNMQCLNAPACLVSLGPRHFQSLSRDIQIVMSKIKNPADIALLAEQNAQGVGRMIGAYQQVGQNTFAENIIKLLEGTPYKINIANECFNESEINYFQSPSHNPLYARIKSLWKSFRGPVLACKPQIEPLNIDKEAYLATVEALKIDDAYHSLSIEQYRVTPELIQKIANNQWNPDFPEDKNHIEALAAKGYLQAFNLVKENAGQVFSGEKKASDIFIDQHQNWFQQLFSPSITANILKPIDLIGYRRHMVFLRGSLHVPPHFDHLLDGMEALKECMNEEGDAFVKATLGHFFMGYIHPFMDGNGRTARFTMNVMLAEGHYPWTVIPVEQRDHYMKSLEIASVENNIEIFAQFISEHVIKAYEQID